MWKLLGIDPMGNVKSIKSAFVLRVQEEGFEPGSPEFMKLYEACTAACSCARRCRKTGTYLYRFMDKDFEYQYAPDGSFTPVKHYPLEKIRMLMLDRARIIMKSPRLRNSKYVWNYYFYAHNDYFSALLFDREYRKAVSDLVYGEKLSPEAASALAGGFSHGSRAVPYESRFKKIVQFFGIDKTPSDRWTVLIAVDVSPVRGGKSPAPEYTKNISDLKTVLIICGVIALLLVISASALFRERKEQDFSDMAQTAVPEITDKDGGELYEIGGEYYIYSDGEYRKITPDEADLIKNLYSVK